MTPTVTFDDLVRGVAKEAVRDYSVDVESLLEEVREATGREDLVDRLRLMFVGAQWDAVRLALATVLANAPTRPEWAEAAREVLAEFADPADPEEDHGPPERG